MCKDLTSVPTKQAEGLPKDRLKHIDSPVSKFTAENVLSRWKTGFHGDFTLLLRTSRTAMFKQRKMKENTKQLKAVVGLPLT